MEKNLSLIEASLKKELNSGWKELNFQYEYTHEDSYSMISAQGALSTKYCADDLYIGFKFFDDNTFSCRAIFDRIDLSLSVAHYINELTKDMTSGDNLSIYEDNYLIVARTGKIYNPSDAGLIASDFIVKLLSLTKKDDFINLINYTY